MVNFRRNIEPYLGELLHNFPVVAIIGARQVGKTTLATSVGKDFYYLDLEKGSDYDRVTHDIEFFFNQHPQKVIIDEAQQLPSLFPILRGVIDQNRQQKGRFILTGSSSPELLENISETLAGRIAIIELGTLKANEYFDQPLSDFYNLFKQPLTKEFTITTSPISLPQMQLFWLQGGYPEPIAARDNAYHAQWMSNYQSTYINRDIARLFPKLNKIAYRRFITMLGKLSSKIINKSDLARAIGVSEPTIRHYLAIADGTFLWRELPSYENNFYKSVVKMPRGHMRDSGLLHSLLHIDTLEKLQSDPIAGFSFEAFVTEEILKGMQDAKIHNFTPYYFRTRGGAEIDLILEGTFGLLPIEIKYGSTIIRRQLRNLSDFITIHQIPFGVVINQSESLEWLTENILQIPAGYI